MKTFLCHQGEYSVAGAGAPEAGCSAGAASKPAGLADSAVIAQLIFGLRDSIETAQSGEGKKARIQGVALYPRRRAIQNTAHHFGAQY
ncbi:MAG TPA: hypothetical protein VF861_10430 [Telluria sp.]